MPSDSELGIWFCTAQSTRLVAHQHQRLEINLVMAGTLSYEVGSGVVRVGAGEMLLLPPGVEHRLCELSEDLAFWVAEVDADDHVLCRETHVVHPSGAWRGKLVRCLRKLWLRPDAEKQGRLLGELGKLLREADDVRDEQVSSHPAVKKARSICEAELGGELEIAELAKRSGLSESRLAHLFQEQLGVTPLQYKNYVRLQAFIRAEQENPRDVNLLRAALEAGFGSYPQFHRVFHQVCGAAPAAHLQWLGRSDAVDVSGAEV